MYSAAFKGHTEAVRILIRAKANPRFVVTSPSGNKFVPLHMAAQYGLAARVSYVSDTLDPYGRTPVLSGIDLSPERSCSPRIVLMLIDARADISAVERITNMLGGVAFNGTPLSITERILRERKIYGRDATVEQLRKLEADRRLLLRVAAVRAGSWLWPSDCSDTLALAEGKAKAAKTETPLAKMLPVLRQRARRRTALLVPLFRYSSRW